jgi:hypothetical protein
MPSPRPLTNKILHDLQFLVATGLESAGVVKYVAVMIGEYKYILDVVLAALSKDQESQSAVRMTLTSMDGSS